MKADLAFTDLSFTYPGRACRPALDRATACLKGGSAVAVVGPSGAGKSTLCKVLNGVLRGGGRVTFGGEEIHPYRCPGQYVAYSFQNPDDQLFLPTVRQELAFGPRNVGLSGAALEAAVARALDLFGLRGLAEAHPLDLPFGLRKRVALAAALAMGRPWTVLDEPTLGQDPSSCDQLAAAAAQWLRGGRGLLIISHDPEFLLEVCDQVLQVRQGRCSWSGPREAFLRDPPPGAADFQNLAARLSRDLGLSPPCATRAALRDRLGSGGEGAENIVDKC